MRAFTASLAPPTPTSTSTPAGTSSARSWSRSTRRSGRGPSCSRPSWKHEHVALGTNTDPYQWVEKKYELLPGVWEAMRDSGTPCSVLTKSPLLLRDIELFKQIPDFAANLSDPDPGREGLARQRAAHAPPAQADRGRGRAQPGRHPHRRADRAADARHQRLAGAGGAHPRAVRRGGRGEHRRHLPAPARRGARGVHGLAALLPPRPGAALRGALRPRRLRARRRSASGSRSSCGPGGASCGRGSARRPPAAAWSPPGRGTSSRRSSRRDPPRDDRAPRGHAETGGSPPRGSR